MRSPAAGLSITLSLLTVLAGSTASAWDKEEHRLLADSVFVLVMRQCAKPIDSTAYLFDEGRRSIRIERWAWDGVSFGDRAAFYAADDMASSRFHRRGRSVMDQLRSVTSASLQLESQTQPDNVVAAYLTAHMQALRIAEQAAQSSADLHDVLIRALEREALAQGYLSDAFAAGHILSYREGLLTFLARRNRIEAHNYHRNRGVYVINGRGEVWQTFGDGLLLWYPATYDAVSEACGASLKELIAVWYISAGLELPDRLTDWLAAVAPAKTPAEAVGSWLSEHSGQEYYAEVRLPTLMLLPMPVAATWSFRTDEVDSHGVREHHYYPQLQENGLHDPDLSDIDCRYLYPRESVPDWMVPEPLRASSAATAHELVTSSQDWASVRYDQARTAPASYKGLLVQLGGQVTVRRGQGHLGGSIGLGYGLWDDLLLIQNISVAAAFMPSFHEPDHRLLTGSLGLDFDLPGEAWLKALRLEGGVAFGLGHSFNDFGPLFAIGLDSRVMPLGFTYAGATWRLKYQWFSLDTPVSGPALEIILQ